MEKTSKEFPYGKDNKDRLPWEHYLAEYKQADPQEITERTQLPYDPDAKTFEMKLLGTVYFITWPEFEVSHKEDSIGYYPLEEMIAAKILAIRYLLYGEPSLAGGEFFTYREMPSGDLYIHVVKLHIRFSCGELL